MKRIFRRLGVWIHTHEPILFILPIVALLRVPSLFEPYWYGDESIYLTLGLGIRRGLELYRQIHDNKPPFLYLMAAIAGGNQFWFKLLAMGSVVATVGIFWKLATNWWVQRRLAIFSTVIFGLLICLPTLEGTIANAELFFLLPTIIAFYLLYTGKSRIDAFKAGLVLGLAALFKMPAILEIIIWPLFWLGVREKDWFWKSAYLGIGGALPLIASGLFYATRGTLNSYLIAAGLQNIPYLSSWQAVSGWVGTLRGRGIVLAIGITIFWLLRRHLDKRVFLVSLWWLVTLFAALLSGRPYPHYLLQLTGAFSLGYIFLVAHNYTSRVVVMLPLVLTILGVSIFKFSFYPVVSYYQNFALWATGFRNQSDYYGHFDTNVNRDYQVARLIMQNSLRSDRIFVWGDHPSIYALSKRLPVGKYTAAYHIRDFSAEEETVTLLNQTPPRYIVTFHNAHELPRLEMILKDNYLLEKEIGSAQVYRRIGV